ncbi:MAG: S-adenosylmethionine:tRNA ribosyltransferase-isomerase [Anaerolineales bacterium]|nr:S-adenosylmethionine:tRNA ribosyltransferase-isomerase [Anaerolineales bacterium]
MVSAEMPSAGSAFTPDMITRLVYEGILIDPLVLHAGVSSLEGHEPPYAERFRVPEDTAWLVNQARRRGKRIIAVGTTAVRALESAVDHDGTVQPAEGWTDLVITPGRGLWTVDGLLTGFHEPRSSHLSMLLALMDQAALLVAYQEAIEEEYLWHEFGDLHLILP